MVSYISMSQIIFDYVYFQIGQGSTEANRELLRKRLFRNKRKLRSRGVSSIYEIQMAELILYIEQYASTIKIADIQHQIPLTDIKFAYTIFAKNI